MTASDEMMAIAQRLRTEAAHYEEIADEVQRVREEAQRVGKSAGGSWLGYHANVYYANLEVAPPGAHFSQEWGLGGEEWLGLSSTGDWREFDPDKVRETIYERAGVPNLENANEAAKRARQVLNDCRSDAESVLIAQAESHPDAYLISALERLKSIDPPSKTEVLNRMHGGGRIMTRDTTALGQGTRVPPHADLVGLSISIEQVFTCCREAADICSKAASHIERRKATGLPARTQGTHVFIGHGRSGAWRELKDFLAERLKLQYDEFNRVPIAGVSNTERLSEMLNSAAVAFLILTAEDETSEGKMQPRMNVVHEAGLFQGRLGFRKAIVLLEEGCEPFSNIDGLGQIRFPSGRISACFEQVREVLEREEMLVPL